MELENIFSSIIVSRMLFLQNAFAATHLMRLEVAKDEILQILRFSNIKIIEF